MEGAFFAREVRLLGSVAQLVERTTETREVTGSTPVGATQSPHHDGGLCAFRDGTCPGIADPVRDLKHTQGAPGAFSPPCI